MTNNKAKIRIIQHAGFWTVYIGFYTMITGLISGNYLQSLYIWLLTAPLYMVFTYFHLYVIIPSLLLRRKYVAFFAVFIAAACLFILTDRAYTFYVLYPLLFENFKPGASGFFNLSALCTLSVTIYSVVLLACAIKLFKQWYFSQKIKTELEIRNKASEIALLRSQVNPHFLFNTINNIHSLISIDTKKAEDSLIKLSDIMRYMLYNSNTGFVPLEREILYLSNYIELQKLRLINPKLVDFRIEGRAEGRVIAPMILIPFVENAFKHGDKTTASGGINISLTIHLQHLEFIVSNGIHSQKSLLSSEYSGIGLQNVRRRLELIYPDRHRLENGAENTIYTIKLTIFDT